MTAKGSHASGSGSRRRRTHHKSKKGCTECKKRHIKCDEGWPQCANCISTLRSCSFQDLPDHRAGPATPTVHVKTGKLDAAPSKTGTGLRFAAIHLICLHHAETQMEKYMALHCTARPIIDLALDNVTTAPFLLDQVLALSALHLSDQDATKKTFYHQQATELQTRALELFNQAREGDSDDNTIPVFVFASLLGIHVLRETFSSHRNDLSAFVDSFIHYVGLHRGVRAVIANGSWPLILQSDLKPLLYLSTLSDDLDTQTPGEDTQTLKKILSEYDSGQESIQACQSALERVQWMLDLCNKNPSRDDIGIHATMAWPLLVPKEYIEALHKHCPEALAVLAFYAAALHRYRTYWVFGDSGSSLLSAILNTIGSFWRGNLGTSFETMGIA
ncbi:Upc2 protein [Pyrenochaeta sp. DS3sAY3a]|nr:Upc2 protein [Pyrenochaeta sp. DS3sAY3a]